MNILTNPSKIFLLDTNVLITAAKLYYSFDICPGFWELIIQAHEREEVMSIDRVKKELAEKEDDITQWLKTRKLGRFFASCDVATVQSHYKKINSWANMNTQYEPDAKTGFADSADGWLVAYSMANRTTVVTLEQSAPNSRVRIKLPDVCKEFEVACTNPFNMLESLGARFVLGQAAR